MKTSFYLFASLVLLSVLCGMLYYNTVLVDTQAYVPSVYYMQGKELWEEDVERVEVSYAFKRPLEIAAAALLEPLFGVRQAYSVLNMLLYIGTTVLTYLFFKRLFQQHESRMLLAYLGAVLYATSLPLILYATRVLVDVASYFTLLLGLLFIESIFEKEKITWKEHLSVALLLGLFLLVRDTVVILYPYYLLRFLWKEGFQFSALLQKTVSLWPFVFTLLPQFLFMLWFDVGFLLTGKGAAITAGKYSLLGLLKFGLVHLAAFHVAYLFAFFGIQKETDTQRKHFYWMYGISALFYLLGIQLIALTSPRFSMVLFPVVLAAASRGIFAFAQKMSAWQKTVSFATLLFLCLFLYAVLSFLGAWLYPGHILIPEDAGADAVLRAFAHEIQLKLGGLFSW